MKDSEPIIFSIVIPVTSEKIHLKNLLESIEIQDFEPGKFEFVFILNPSDQEARSIISEFENKHGNFQVKRLHYTGQSLLEARNEGIKKSAGKTLIFIEDDIIFEKDYFKNLVKDTRGLEESIFVGGGKILPVFEQQKPPWLIKFFMPLLAEVNLKEKYKTFPPKKYPFGINMLVQRSVFDKIGLFDPSPEINHGEEHIVLSEKKFIEKTRKNHIPVYYFPNLLVWNYVPPKYLNRAYLRKQAEIALQVELEKAKNKGNMSLSRFLLKELLKYLGTFGIGFYYLITTQWEKLKSIFQYRYWSFNIMLKTILNKKT